MRISDFGFSIPQSAKEAKRKRTENIRSTRAMKGAHRNHTILLVDDEDLILEVLVEMFEEMGYRTYSARCAEEAQKVMGRAEIEVVVSDIEMPGLSGIDLLRGIGFGGDRNLPDDYEQLWRKVRLGRQDRTRIFPRLEAEVRQTEALFGIGACET